MIEVSDAIIAATAPQVRIAYVHEYRRRREAISGTAESTTGSTSYLMPRWDGGRDAFGRRYSPIWPKIAKLLLEHEWPIGKYIAAQFSDGLPSPNILLSISAQEKYRRSVPAAYLALEVQHNQDAHQFAAATIEIKLLFPDLADGVICSRCVS